MHIHTIIMVQSRRCNKRKSLRKRGGTKSQKSRKSKSGVKSVAFKSAIDPPIDHYIHWATNKKLLNNLTKEYPEIDNLDNLELELKHLAGVHADKIKAARDYLEKNPRGKVGIVFYLFTPGDGLNRIRIEPDMTKQQFDESLNKEHYFTSQTYYYGLYPSFTFK